MNKIKHIEIIQNVISRMNTNSFILKGWCITIISALFVLSQTNSNNLFFLFAIVPCLAFWIVDGFFISTERRFRELYKSVIKLDEKDIDFSMDISGFKECRNTWIGGIFSKTLIPFYGMILVGLGIFYYILTK